MFDYTTPTGTNPATDIIREMMARTAHRVVSFVNSPYHVYGTGDDSGDDFDRLTEMLTILGNVYNVNNHPNIPMGDRSDPVEEVATHFLHLLSTGESLEPFTGTENDCIHNYIGDYNDIYDDLTSIADYEECRTCSDRRVIHRNTR